jgi:hypothetical protein
LSPVIMLYRKTSSPLLLKQESKQAIADMFPVPLSLFQTKLMWHPMNTKFL